MAAFAPRPGSLRLPTPPERRSTAEERGTFTARTVIADVEGHRRAGGMMSGSDAIHILPSVDGSQFGLKPPTERLIELKLQIYRWCCGQHVDDERWRQPYAAACGQGRFSGGSTAPAAQVDRPGCCCRPVSLLTTQRRSGSRDDASRFSLLMSNGPLLLSNGSHGRAPRACRSL